MCVCVPWAVLHGRLKPCWRALRLILVCIFRVLPALAQPMAGVGAAHGAGATRAVVTAVATWPHAAGIVRRRAGRVR